MSDPTLTANCSSLLRGIVKFLLVLSLFPAAFVAWRVLLHDPSDMPLCNKETLVEVMNWFDIEKRDDLPNIGGRSAPSLLKLKRYEDDTGRANNVQALKVWNDKYQYIPGLQRGDPNDLVLMYMKAPTRWQNHATGPPSIFEERKWVLVPLDFLGAGMSYCAEKKSRTVEDESECAERVPLGELKSRLRKTLEYLEKNNRPNWQTVVAENDAFLKWIESQ